MTSLVERTKANSIESLHCIDALTSKSPVTSLNDVNATAEDTPAELDTSTCSLKFPTSDDVIDANGALRDSICSTSSNVSDVTVAQAAQTPLQDDLWLTRSDVTNSFEINASGLSIDDVSDESRQKTSTMMTTSSTSSSARTSSTLDSQRSSGSRVSVSTSFRAKVRNIIVPQRNSDKNSRTCCDVSSEQLHTTEFETVLDGSASGRKNSRPRSFNEATIHALQTQQHPVSPQQSNESLLNSLKHAVTSLTSRITRIGGNRSAQSSPRHASSQFVRSKSVGAENDARVRQNIVDPLSPRASPPKTAAPPLKKAKDRQRGKRVRLIGLARSGSDCGNRKKSGDETSRTPAERLAVVDPERAGALTLRRNRKQRHDVNKPVVTCVEPHLNLVAVTSQSHAPSPRCLHPLRSKSSDLLDDLDLGLSHDLSIDLDSSHDSLPGASLVTSSLCHDSMSQHSFYEQTLEATLDASCDLDSTSFDSDSLVITYAQAVTSSNCLDSRDVSKQCVRFDNNTTCSTDSSKHWSNIVVEH